MGLTTAKKLILLGGSRINIDQYLLDNNGSRWSFRTAAASGGQLMQESNGPTPADDAGEAIGLVLDQGLWGGRTLAQVIAAATELVTNGDFSGTTGWTGSNATLSAAGGVLTVTATTNGTAARAQQTISGLVAGNIYRLSLSIRKPNGTTPSTGAFVSGATGGSTPYTTSSTTVPTVIYFVATSTSHVLNLDLSASGLVAGITAEFSGVSIKLIPGIPGIQSTGGFKSQWQAGGWDRYDGSDDRHTQSRLMGSAGIVLIRSKFIAKSAGTRIMFGAVGSGGTDRLYCGNDTNGYAVARVGNGSTISGSVDRTDVDGTVGVVWDGTQAGLVEDGNVTYQSQTGAPTTTVAPIIGGYNNNGTPGTFSNFDAKDVVYLPIAPNAATIKKLHNALMAA